MMGCEWCMKVHGSVPFNEYHEHDSGKDHVHEEPIQKTKKVSWYVRCCKHSTLWL